MTMREENYIMQFRIFFYLLLFLITGAPSVAMEEDHKDNFFCGPAQKKFKTSEIETKNLYLMAEPAEQSSAVEFPHELVRHSKILNNFVNTMKDLGQPELPLDINILDVDINVIKIINMCLKWVDQAHSNGSSKRDIILDLSRWIKSIGFLNYPLKTIAELLKTTSYLDCEEIYHALTLLIAQTKFTLFVNSKNSSLPHDIITDIWKAYLLSYPEPKEDCLQVKLSINDLYDYGLIDKQILPNNMPLAFENVFNNKFNNNCLQHSIDALFAHPYFVTYLHLLFKEMTRYLQGLSQEHIKVLFSTISDDSTLKIAACLVYAKKYSENIGEINYMKQMADIKKWVNSDAFEPEPTPLTSEKKFRHILPLLSELLGEPIIKIAICDSSFCSIPYNIYYLCSLQELRIVRSRLKELPVTIGNLTNLRELNLEGNHLKEIPPPIFKLHNLKYLCISENKLEKIPYEIGLLVNLTWLELSNNKIKELPCSMGKLVNLKKFHIDTNKLCSLPKTILNLPSLERISLQQNQLPEKEIETLKHEFSKRHVDANFF